MGPADLHGADDVVARSGDHNADGLDAIDAGVGRVKRARNLVEPHFTLDPGLEILAETIDVHEARIIPELQDCRIAGLQKERLEGGEAG
jgi:hypothetical protein